MILYFSPTGNSRYIAKLLSEKIDDETVSLLERIKNKDCSPIESEKPWVVVSPIYVAEMPNILYDFLKKLDLRGNRDIYFVFTAASSMSCAGYFAKAMVEKKGMNYMGSGSVRMPVNYPVFFTVKEDCEAIRIIEDAAAKLDSIADDIKSGRQIEEKIPSSMEIKVTIPTAKLYNKYFTKADKFFAKDSCIGCGTCEKLCPSNNISIVNKKPNWGNACVHCMSCLSNCPADAVEYGKVTSTKRKYHFPKLDKFKTITRKKDFVTVNSEGKPLRVVVAGAFGHLGSDIVRALVKNGYEVVAAGREIRKPKDLQDGYETFQFDLSKPESFKGMCDGADVVITTVGLTKTSADTTNYDIDYQGNKYILEEAKRAGVKNFAYVSVIKADKAPDVPMLHAKYLFEQELIKSGLDYVIFRPSGYFYDIAKVFMPMIEKGKVTLLGNKPIYANVVDTPDFADFIVRHMTDNGKSYDIGGKETYSYEEMAKLFFDAAGKEPKISHAPALLFDVLAYVNRKKKNGKEAIIKFSKFTLTENLVGDTIVGDASFKEYVNNLYSGNKKKS